MVDKSKGGDDNNCIGDWEAYDYLAFSCLQSAYTNGGDSRQYQLTTINSFPDAFRTSSVGDSSSFTNIQPTLYIGNLFIYAG